MVYRGSDSNIANLSGEHFSLSFENMESKVTLTLYDRDISDKSAKKIGEFSYTDFEEFASDWFPSSLNDYRMFMGVETLDWVVPA